MPPQAQPVKESLSHDPLISQTIEGRYFVEQLIGRGGVGLVYLAKDRQDGDRQVVVKVLAPHWAEDKDAVARFDREAKRMGKLDHPNVVKMFGHGHHAGTTYIVMEFLDGEPLRRYLNRRTRLDFEEFIPVASQILAGVGYVHARDTMLRDIKPPNIMLCERDGKANHVKLLDFGLAKLIEEEDEITKAHVIGTAGYLAPEQIKGEPIDVRVDVYALGILFFIMLTGESPIVGENDGAVLFNHVHGTPKQLRQLLPGGHGVPDAVIELVHACLEKDPEKRPQDANEMAEVLFETVHPSLFVLPDASAQTRAPAQEYWVERLERGSNAVSLDDLESSSAEFTRPVLKRTLDEAREAAKVSESGEFDIVDRKPAPPSPPSRPAQATAPSRHVPPKGRAAKMQPPKPPPARRPTAPPLAPKPKPGAPAATAEPEASSTLTGMPQIKPSELDPAEAAAAPVESEAEAIAKKRTIMGIPRPKPSSDPTGPGGAVPTRPATPSHGTPVPSGIGGPTPMQGAPPVRRPLPVPPKASLNSPVPRPTARAGSGKVTPGTGSRKPRRNRVPTIGTAVLKASATKRRFDDADDALDPETIRVSKEDAKRMAAAMPPPKKRVTGSAVPGALEDSVTPPKGMTMPPGASSLPGAPAATGRTVAPGRAPAQASDPPKGQTVAMDAGEARKAAQPIPAQSNPGVRPVGLDLFDDEDDRAAAAALLATAPPANESGTKLSVILVVAGIAALTLGAVTAYFALGGDDGDEAKTADATVVVDAKPVEKDDAGDPDEAAADGTPPEPVAGAGDAVPEDTTPPEAEAGADAAEAADAADAADGEDDAIAEVDLELGSIEVTAKDGAWVFIDDEDMGPAPYRGELGVGTHAVRVTLPGHLPFEQEVEIAAGDNPTLVAELMIKERPRSGGKRRGGKGTGSGHKNPDPTPSTPPPSKDPPATKPTKKGEKGDVFMNTDKGKPSGGIFLPVGKK